MSLLICRQTGMFILSLFFIAKQSQAQSNSKEAKPYKVITTGKHFTIKSTKNIQNLMVWTTDGHRVVEQREINANSYSFSTPFSDRVFFLMVTMENGKVYTEKIGINNTN